MIGSHATGITMLCSNPDRGAPVRRLRMAMLDMIVTIGGIVYGAVLVSVVLFRNRFTEMLRIDALMVPKPTDATRMINPVIGVLLIAYDIYSLIT